MNDKTKNLLLVFLFLILPLLIFMGGIAMGGQFFVFLFGLLWFATGVVFWDFKETHDYQ